MYGVPGASMLESVSCSFERLLAPGTGALTVCTRLGVGIGVFGSFCLLLTVLGVLPCWGGSCRAVLVATTVSAITNVYIMRHAYRIASSHLQPKLD